MTMLRTLDPTLPRVSSGVAGLDAILGGGFPRDRVYLIQGGPGLGKTTLGLQILRQGVRDGETVMYVTLSESRVEIEQVARSHGWQLDGIELLEYASEDEERRLEQHTIFHSSEVDLTETVRDVLAEVERVRPKRLVFDSLSELRLLAGEHLVYRREILSLKRYFAKHGCTVFLLDDTPIDSTEIQIQSICHGVVAMQDLAPEYGTDRRRIRIRKMRGMAFHGGYHDYTIKTGGLQVFPRVRPEGAPAKLEIGALPSGNSQLDAIVGGGLDRGSSVMIVGPSGTGKSSLATRYVLSAAERGERSTLFLFEESIPMLLARTRGVGMDIQPHYEAGTVQLQTVDPAELAPNEFVDVVRHAVEQDGARIVVIDSLNGYLHAMPGEQFVSLQMHELLAYTSSRGVTAIVIVGQEGLNLSTGAPLDLSYLADTVLLLRYFEFKGSIRTALSVFKRRSMAHERTIREMRLGGPAGLTISEPLTQFRGLLTGVPFFQSGAEVPEAL